MKTYKVKMLTEFGGIIEREISDTDNLEILTKEIRDKHGDFITLSSEEIISSPKNEPLPNPLRTLQVSK